MNETNNSKMQSIITWGIFVLILALIVWGLIAAGNKNSGLTTEVVTLAKPVSASDWTIGSSTAPVTMVEYADFQCPACQTYAPLIQQLIEQEGNKLFFVYRYFPLPQHSNAISSAEAAQAAGLQGKFWEMHDKLFANYADWEDLADPTSIYLGYAQAIGISTTTFLKDMTSAPVVKLVKDSYQEAIDSKLDYTPTIFINGKRIVNPQSFAAFKKVIDDAASSTVSVATSSAK